MNRLFAAFAIFVALVPYAYGQSTTRVTGVISDRSTTNGAQLIVAGGTWQLLYAGNTGRNSLTFEVNDGTNTTDVCYLIFGSNITSQITPGTTTLSSNITVNNAAGSPITMTTKQAAQSYSNKGSYGRYWPLAPSDPIYVTCDTTGKSVYADTQ